MLNTLVLTVSLLLLANSALLDAAFSDVYNDEYARSMVKVCGAAYSKNPAKCIENIDEFSDDWVVVKSYNTSCSPISKLNATCQFIILKSDVQRQYIVAFRGTVGVLQLAEQFLSPIPVNFQGFGKVNSYFGQAFWKLWPQVALTLRDAKPNEYSIVVTGYSLGGALATLTAFKLVNDGFQTSDNVYLLTYGSPRAGTVEFSKYVDKTLKYHHRVVNQADPVPNLPPCIPIGFHSCNRWLPDSYFHVAQEVWYQNGSGPNAQYYTERRGEDPRGSNKLGLKRNLPDHLSYFGYNLEKYGENDCE